MKRQVYFTSIGFTSGSIRIVFRLTCFTSRVFGTARRDRSNKGREWLWSEQHDFGSGDTLGSLVSLRLGGQVSPDQRQFGGLFGSLQ